MDDALPGSDPLSRIRVAAAVLLGLEALGLLALATFALGVVAQAAGAGRFGTGLGVFLILFALLLVIAARSVLRGGRFGPGYGITWQLFQVLVGGSLLGAGFFVEGLLAVGLAVAVFVLLVRLARAGSLPGGD